MQRNPGKMIMNSIRQRRSRAIKPAAARIVILVLLLQAALQAQDLEAYWANYLSSDAQYESITAREQQWLTQQRELNEEIHSLQEGQSWYNGWIVEIMLARKSTRQVALADSLRLARERIAGLETQRDEAFRELRQVYQQLLLDSESEGQLSQVQKEQALLIGSRLIDQSNNSIDLPDYSSILNNPYDNESVKRLVLQDLQLVLQLKLSLIDSLLVVKESELALLNRLNEFHRDLGYQRQSDLDPGSGSSGEYENLTSSSDIGTDDRTFETFGGVDDSEYLKTASDRGFATPVEQDRLMPDGADIQLDATPIDEVIEQLTGKRRQYQDLLMQIETQLPY